MAEQTISVADVKIGDNITVWLDRGNHGQGGILQGPLPVWPCNTFDTITILAPGDRTFTWPITDVHHLSVDRPLPADDCLDHSDECRGPVEMWTTGTSMRAWPRCTFHRDRRWASYDKSIERYADSDVAPDGFDPADAGERWENEQ